MQSLSTAVRAKPRYVLAALPSVSRDTEDQVRNCLDRLLVSRQLVRSRRLLRLLRHIVEQTLAGQRRELSEMAIGLAVFDRLPSSYNPSDDPIVRVQVRRLRDKLALYYATEGRDDPLHITVPCGAYVAVFRDPALPTTPAALAPRFTAPAPEPTGDVVAPAGQFAGNDASDAPVEPVEPGADPVAALIVTPLLSLNLDARDRLFVEGVNEEFIGALTRAADGGALAPGALHICTQRLGDYLVSPDLARHARVLEGSIRRAGDETRASLRLSRAVDGRVLWAGQFDQPSGDALATQEALCAAMLDALGQLGGLLA